MRKRIGVWTKRDVAIILPPMLRKLIALIVLVTGLAAVGTPAQARVFDVESVRTVDAEQRARRR